MKKRLIIAVAAIALILICVSLLNGVRNKMIVRQKFIEPYFLSNQQLINYIYVLAGKYNLPR